jgi:DNA polymerase mu
MSDSSRFSNSTASNGQSDLFRGLTFKVIDAKLTPEKVQDLVGMIEQNDGRMATDIVEADVVICAVRTRSRLERHLKWDLAVSPGPVLSCPMNV